VPPYSGRVSSADRPRPGRTVEQTSWDNWHGRKLREAQQLELRERYGEGSSEPGTAPSEGDVTVFLVAREPSGEAVGCGALRQLDETTGEIKRMFVPVEHRGRGISHEILLALEKQARIFGWTRLVLETGERQPEAIGLYRTASYLQIPNFGPYAGEPTSLCFAKDL